MTWLIGCLQDHPELALFLTLSLGYAVGKIRIGSFRIGTVTGVLIVGVFVGQFDIQINGTVKSVFFLLFLYALGYNVGPGFFKALKKDGISQVIFAAIVGITGLVSVIIAGKILGYNAGQAVGLAAGALTQSAVIGVGQDAITGLTATTDQIKTMSDFVPIGYAVTYIFGTIGSVLFLSVVAPKLLGIELQEECKKIEQDSRTVIEGTGISSAISTIAYRSVLLAEEYVGRTVKEIEDALSSNRIRAFIVRIRRGDFIMDAKAEFILEKGDCIVVSCRQDGIGQNALLKLGKEVSDFELLDFPVEKLQVSIREDRVAYKSIRELYDQAVSRAVYIVGIRRNGTEIAYQEEFKVRKKDMIAVEGPKEVVEKFASEIGKPIKRTSETDVVFLGVGILLGGLIGIPALTVAGIQLSLSTSGGVLITGLIFGYLHDRWPMRGYIPKSTLWFMNNVGLAAFIAVVGINSGPGFVSGLKTSGVSFFLAGVVVTLLPLLVGVLIGKYIFKWNGALILGACAGAMTTTPSLGAVCEKAKSNVPVLSYTVTYAVGNIILTIWGAVVVIFFA